MKMHKSLGILAVVGGGGGCVGSHCFQGGKGARVGVSRHRQSVKWGCRKLTANINLLPRRRGGES